MVDSVAPLKGLSTPGETSGQILRDRRSEAPATILLVDDKSENLIALESILQEPGRRLLRATSGSQALGLLLKENVALILLDVRMPGMDGLETAQLIRKRTKDRHTPIIFLTAADTTPEEVEQAYSAGAVDYVFKPFAPEILRSKVQVFIELFRKTEELRESEEHIRLMVEGVRDYSISMLDAQGMVVSWNHGGERLFGYSAQEIIGRSLSMTYPQDDAGRGLYDESLKAAERNGRSIYEGRRIRKDGTEFWAQTVTTALRETNGRLRGFSRLTHDTTERRQSEEELRRSNAELQEFAYVASHDLQEPLRAVAGCVQLLKKRYAQAIDSKADEYINHAVAGVNRMQNLIEDLLTYSRLGRREQSYTMTDCTKLLDDVRNDLRASIEESGAQITADPLPAILADSVQLQQLLQNLLSNAIKFRRGKPEIHVSARQQQNEWVFSVRDNGIGIDPQYFERIFAIFQRLHTRSAYPGTGMGLAICRKIVERHGGKIWVESEPGKGSTFLFSIPDRRSSK